MVLFFFLYVDILTVWLTDSLGTISFNVRVLIFFFSITSWWYDDVNDPVKDKNL